MIDDRFTATPEGWANIPEGVFENARAKTWDALHQERAVGRVADYYSREKDFAGSTFLSLGPCDGHRFTTGDLLALTLLQVRVSPAVVRRLTEPGRTRGQLERFLAEDRLPIDSDLMFADVETLEDMSDFHRALKRAISATEESRANPWVTASKLTARKRPDLFPVRDSVTSKLLGIGKNYEVDWQVYRRLLQDDDVRGRLDQVVDQAASHPGVDIGSPNRRLRHLDVVLWMHARKGVVSGSPQDE